MELTHRLRVSFSINHKNNISLRLVIKKQTEKTIPYFKKESDLVKFFH